MSYNDDNYNLDFNSYMAAEMCVEWIRDWFENNGNGCKAVIGISGGKDSSVVAALCVKALGKERVFGVLMPNGEQADINYANELCEFLGINNVTINIESFYDTAIAKISDALETALSEQTTINLPARLRMATLYAVSQTVGGRVINTCNYSEDYIGYATRYGDGAGDMAPLAKFTVQEVKSIGRFLGLPEKFIEKTPSDGLCGKTDEDNLGFSYDTLDKYIRYGVLPKAEIKSKIDNLHKKNEFKLKPMPSFDYIITVARQRINRARQL